MKRVVGATLLAYTILVNSAMAKAQEDFSTRLDAFWNFNAAATSEARFRKELASLWDRVGTHNRERPPPEGGYRTTFYFGQHLELEERDEEPA